MITFYSGTPGSGKSFHMAKDIMFKLRLGRNIICSENINTNLVSKNGRKKIGNFVHKPLEEMNPEFFYLFAYKNHIKGKERQTTIIMDECHRIFNPREYSRKDRKDWLIFFSEHRHIGYDIILVSQNDRQIDRQIRSQFEHEIKHRKFNNMFMLGFIFPTLFLCIETYYGNNRIISKKVMKFKKRIAAIYDSYAKFEEFIKRMEQEDNKKHGVNNKVAQLGTDAPPDTPNPNPNCVTQEEALEPPTMTEADTQMGVGGPHRSGRFGGDWWLKGFTTARIR